MNSLLCRITLLSDASFPERAASLGGGRSLSYVPGSALLGAAAARYDDFERHGLARSVFHLGAVRFGDGTPEAGPWRATLAAPLCVHKPKEWPSDGDRVLTNRARTPLARQGGDAQEKPLDVGSFVYFDAARSSLTPIRTRREYSLRTAMGTAGRGLDHHLYGIDALRAGQSFLARIDADDAALLYRVREALGSTARLGRSRNAELGEVVLEFRDSDEAARGSSWSKGDTVLLFCASNLEVRGCDSGQPALAPSARDLGLDRWLGGRVEPGTFVRSRRVSFVRHGSWDPERQFLVAGSVLAYEAKSDDAAGLRAAVATGLGDHRSAGWGRVEVNPAWLASESLRWEESEPEREPPSDEAPFPSEHITGALRSRLAALPRARAAAQLTGTIVRAVEDSGAQLAPSQWRELGRLAAASGTDLAHFQQSFQRFATTGVRKLEASWGQQPARPLGGSDGGPLWRQLLALVPTGDAERSLTALTIAARTLAENEAAARQARGGGVR